MKEKIVQYKNLILVAFAVILVIGIIAADPLGFCAQRIHDRAAIHNQIAIEKAEAEKQIAIIKAQTDAELRRIEEGKPAEETAGEEITEAEVDTPGEEREQ